jgi:DNA-binding transcriptional MerR regulator
MELLTIAEIAKRLSIPESTVRYYRDMFADFVPSVGEGRGRRYTEESLDVLRFIADSLRAGVPKEEVQAMLQQRYPMTIETQQETAVTQQQGAAIMRQLVADAVKDLLDEQARRYEERLADLEKRLEERDQKLMSGLRELLESRRKKTLWERLFGGKGRDDTT